MGFKQRERKRRKKTAIASAQRQARSAGKSNRWWLTRVARDTCCARCGTILRVGREMVYRAEPREARCVPCGEGVSYRPSVRWEQKRAA
jgi:RNase P subunit RPR2